MDFNQLSIIDILCMFCSQVVIPRHKCLHWNTCEVELDIKILFLFSLLESVPLLNLEDEIHFKGVDL